MGGVFALTECAAEGIRGESDPYNAGIAGCAAGLVAGVRCMETTSI
jgi:Tim17/Tim22/Tim23/Pmp24 family